MSVISQLLKQLPRDKHYCVALSGGLDSTVLLHAVVKALPKGQVRAVHIHHGLSPNADQWQQHCETTCAQWNVPLTTVRVNVQTDGKGLEDAARQARYRVFEQQLQSNDILLTAHHSDDQVETLLLRLARGSGPRGLAGMAASRPLGQGELWRPLLPIARETLLAYGREHQLQWIDDESNEDLHFDRNYLRHQVLPPLRRRWPDLGERWGNSAALCGEADQLLREYAREDLERLTVAAPGPVSEPSPVLSLSGLWGLSPGRRQWVLRCWCENNGAGLPTREALAQIEGQLVQGREDAHALVSVGNRTVRRFRGGLYLVPALAGGEWSEEPLSLEGKGAPVALPGGAALQVDWGGAEDICLSAHVGPLMLRWRRGGERCRPVGRAHSQTLKKLLQEYDLPPWWRERVPLVYVGETLVAVPSLWVCEGFQAAAGEPGYRLRWFPEAGPARLEG
ncbi:tRNA lysidine(34) synthetase TilS [Marinimicrobium agarilyticum]|uniref:tRNA lysidine(34) synthetase TilS n=1 Tax=Marinimicrobium agarilyticum TaxID=306546 RepID=UPI0004142738|nr:tRNA lysidine(34) synthetase TilS [Marinimicrobium agarilyticum]